MCRQEGAVEHMPGTLVVQDSGTSYPPPRGWPTHLAPIAIRPPPPKPPDAICIQQIGRLDARATLQLKSEAELQRMEGAPQVCASLPPSALIALPPSLAKLLQSLMRSASAWPTVGSVCASQTGRCEDSRIMCSRAQGASGRVSMMPIHQLQWIQKLVIVSRDCSAQGRVPCAHGSIEGAM